MKDNNRRLFSLIALASGIVLIISAASHADSSDLTGSVIDSLSNPAKSVLAEALSPDCRNKPRWQQVWDQQKKRSVWKKDWVKVCSSTL